MVRMPYTNRRRERDAYVRAVDILRTLRSWGISRVRLGELSAEQRTELCLRFGISPSSLKTTLARVPKTVREYRISRGIV